MPIVKERLLLKPFSSKVFNRKSPSFFIEDAPAEISMAQDRTLYWYAVKVFSNKTTFLRETFTSEKIETYYPMTMVESEEDGLVKYTSKPLISSLLFIRCTQFALLDYKQRFFDYMMYYTEPLTGKPGVIQDKDMENFKMVTSVGGTDLKFFGESIGNMKSGDKVVITDGQYKGATGYVKRIKHDRKVLVGIDGVAVVVISHIPREYLKRVSEVETEEAESCEQSSQKSGGPTS